MSKKQKSSWSLNWSLLLVVVILVAVITVGDFRIYPLVVNRAKTTNWAERTGFGETKVITKTVETDEQREIIKETPTSVQIYPHKTLWDVLELSSRLLVPIWLFIWGIWFQKRDKEKEKEEQKRLQEERNQQEQLEKELAENNLAEEAIQNYLKSMADLLLLNEELPKKLLSQEDNSVGNVARTLTITILRRLEGDLKRQDRIINFLRDAKLYEFIWEKATLSAINLPEINLQQADLKDAKLKGANLEGANLVRARLKDANLEGANLVRARLKGAKLEGANLGGTKLKGADLGGANLKDAYLYGTKLEGANLYGAKLINVQNLTDSQIKSACNWDKAIYKQDHSENQKYIEALKKDKSSDPKEPPDCRLWSR